MAINLTKGQGVSLAKKDGGTIKRIALGVGWDPAKPKGGGGLLGRLFGGAAPANIDLDASCLLYSTVGHRLDEVWFRQLKSKDGSVRHSGDNLTGEGEGDDETITVDLTRLPSDVHHLVFTINSFRGQTFDEVDSAYARVVDEETGQELARYSISEGGRHTAVIMARVSREGAGWKVTALGVPSHGRTFHDMADDIDTCF